MSHHICDQTVKILKKYFIFDKMFDLNQYDCNNMYQLYVDLSKLTKDRYLPNYRFIFLHFETEYYFDKKYPGLTLVNLQRVLSNLDISNYFCLILSQQDISDKLKFLQNQETTDQTAIDSFKYQNYYWTNKYFSSKIDPNIQVDIEKISKKYLCLNRKTRFHRRVLFSLLKKNDLLHDGMVSYQFIEKSRLVQYSTTNNLSLEKTHPRQIQKSSVQPAAKTDLCLLETSTSTRVNDRWLLRDPGIKESLKDISTTYSFKNFKEETDLVKTYRFDSFLEQQCFLHVVTETVYNYPSSFMTEKGIKPILCKRPFVIVGPVGSIKNLKSLGFKTFDQWWDESYDDIEDNEKRLLAVVEIIKNVCSKDITSIRDLCSKMTDVLEYNFDFYVNHFKQQQNASLHEFCKKNLQPRYD